MKNFGITRIWSARRGVRVRSRLGIKGVSGGHLGGGVGSCGGFEEVVDVLTFETWDLDLDLVFRAMFLTCYITG